MHGCTGRLPAPEWGFGGRRGWNSTKTNQQGPASDSKAAPADKDI